MDVDPCLFENVVSDSEVRKIVLSYLFHNCFKETVETFIACSGMKRTADCSVNMDKRKRVESTSLVEEDLYVDWKLGWHEGHASNQSLVDFSLLEILVQRAKCEDVVPNLSTTWYLYQPQKRTCIYPTVSKDLQRGLLHLEGVFPYSAWTKKAKAFTHAIWMLRHSHLSSTNYPSTVLAWIPRTNRGFFFLHVFFLQ